MPLKKGYLNISLILPPILVRGVSYALSLTNFRIS